MLDIDLYNVSYLAFRLAPFILVCFFTLESVLNWNLKGIVYLFGLLFACFITTMAASIFPNSPNVTAEGVVGSTQTSNICNTISLGTGGSVLSSLPLSTAVFSYTFFYLLTFIINMASGGKGFNTKKTNAIRLQDLNTAMRQNAPTLLLFPLLIVIDAAWILTNGCNEWINILVALIISGIIGILWATILVATKNPDLLYVSKSLGDVCNRPSTTAFRCRMGTNKDKRKKITQKDIDATFNNLVAKP